MDPPLQRVADAIANLTPDAISLPPNMYLRISQNRRNPQNQQAQTQRVQRVQQAQQTQETQLTTPAPLPNWVRIVISITCAPEHPGVNGGKGREFNFFDYIPRDMVGRKLETCNVNWEPAGRYFAGIRDRYHNKVLDSQIWDCQFCGEISKNLYMSGMPRLMDFRSWFVVAIPICRTIGLCDQKAVMLVNKIFDERFPAVNIPDGPCCEVCGFIHNLKWCARCKMIQYCSSDCQAHHWQTHKKDCRNAERNKFSEKAGRK